MIRSYGRNSHTITYKSFYFTLLIFSTTYIYLSICVCVYILERNEGQIFFKPHCAWSYKKGVRAALYFRNGEQVVCMS